MNEPVFAYAHQITRDGVDLLRTMVGVIEESHPDSQGIDFATLRVALTDLPFDCGSQEYTLEVDRDDMQTFCRWLRWTSARTGHRVFADFAAGMEQGAKLADQQMRQTSHLN